MLLDHGERILTSATSIFNNRGVKISVKIAGIHWHYGTRVGKFSALEGCNGSGGTECTPIRSLNTLTHILVKCYSVSDEVQ